MTEQIPASAKAWINEPPYCNWSENEKEKALTVFENLMTMESISHATRLLRDLSDLLEYAQTENKPL